MKDLIRKNWKWVAVCILSNVLQWLGTGGTVPPDVNPGVSPSTNPVAE